LGLGTLLGTFAKLTILRELIGNIAVVTTGSPGDCSSSPVTRDAVIIAAEDGWPLRATLLNEAFHYATKSRSPTVTT
jgi:hypothetical protein